MSGAQAYTTKRGKNKRSKEGVRKDNKNNQATALMAQINAQAAKFVVKPKEEIAGTLKGEVAPTLSFIGDKANLHNAKSIYHVLSDSKLETHLRCFNVDCIRKLEDETIVFKRCGKCSIARYCSAECQLADWTKIHKTSCCKGSTFVQPGHAVAVKIKDVYLPHIKDHYTISSISDVTEFHGVVESKDDATDFNALKAAGFVQVRVYNKNLRPTKTFITLLLSDCIATQWLVKKTNEEMQKDKDSRVEESNNVSEEARATENKRSSPYEGGESKGDPDVDESQPCGYTTTIDALDNLHNRK